METLFMLWAMPGRTLCPKAVDIAKVLHVSNYQVVHINENTFSLTAKD